MRLIDIHLQAFTLLHIHGGEEDEVVGEDGTGGIAAGGTLAGGTGGEPDGAAVLGIVIRSDGEFFG